ncbi:MAG: hypothetical protein ACLSAP_11645 [Oscillospiraceae bacterium]
MIASYEYYTEQFGGVKIPAESFYQLEKEAERYLDRVTKRRIRKQGAVTDEVRQAACAVAEIFCQRDRREPGAKARNSTAMRFLCGHGGGRRRKLAWRRYRDASMEAACYFVGCCDEAGSRDYIGSL